MSICGRLFFLSLDYVSTKIDKNMYSLLYVYKKKYALYAQLKKYSLFCNKTQLASLHFIFFISIFPFFECTLLRLNVRNTV